MRVLLAAALICLGAMAHGQEAVSHGTGAVLRGLDKLNATVADIELAPQETHTLGRIAITLDDCRYPVGDPAGDAYAFVTIRETGIRDPIFRGWMIATAPALNAMDHPRYDVWVLRCKTS